MAETAGPPTVVFVTGKLAEPALRKVVGEIAGKSRIEPVVIVLPISVAALLTTDWVARHLEVPAGAKRIVLPGLCGGELEKLQSTTGVPVERGPKDLQDLPEHFGGKSTPPLLDTFDIEIIAEINYAPRLSRDELLKWAQEYRADGADVIDLGCDPGSTWTEIGDAVRMLRDYGLRVSVDSFNQQEVTSAVKAGAELVLSVNSTNVDAAVDWGCEVVTIPDSTNDVASLHSTINKLSKADVRFRIDPILEPITFGFSASLGRYLDFRRRYPKTAMMMGIGNVTELTEVDSAGINMLLAGFCQEQRIGSVLTTQVANWCRNCVREFDLARRIVKAATEANRTPKNISSSLLQLRDRKTRELGDEALDDLAKRITDRNYRLFAEAGEIHVINGTMHLHGTDPFALIDEMMKLDERLSPAHAFYLGYEMCKAITALTLGKNYVQDQSLSWGFLIREEMPRHLG